MMKWRVTTLIILMSWQASASVDYAAWSEQNRDGSWTRAAEKAVANSPLIQVSPADVREFCPRYSRLSTIDRRKFWVGLLSAMALPESGFNPARFFQERFHDAKGRPVVSRGLLQISIESANQKRYDCEVEHAGLLHDPVINLRCGVKILAKWVKDDGVIASNVRNGTHKGGGRYWSTLRKKTGHVEKIQQFTRELSFCKTR